jgi:tetratricopeptide (TPR) repeat protein
MDDAAAGHGTVMRVRRPAVASLILGLLSVLVSRCTSGDRPSVPAGHPASVQVTPGDVRPVSLPDLSTMAESVRTQLRESHDRITRLSASPESPASDLADAYGEMGRLLLAAQCFDEANAYFANARLLNPSDVRWVYYLGQVARILGRLDDAVSFFEEARRGRPDDVATLIWLGEVHLMAGQPDDAEPPLRAALALDSRSVAALYRLARVAVARRNYAAAVRHLEDALALAPDARGLHHPLGIAYRALGDHARASAHLRFGSNEGVAPPDPLMEELNDLLNSSRAWEGRGVRALDRGDWKMAAEHFRRGVGLDPGNPSLHQRLGTALHMMGDAQGADAEFRRALTLSPTHPQSHFSLGVTLETSGHPREALARYAAAVQHDPSYVEARLRLAALLRQVGHVDASRAEYERVVAIAPHSPEGTFGHAMSLVALGRYREARTRLEQGHEAFEGHPDFANALARLLAAAPDAPVRDGRKALAVMEALTEAQKRVDGGEAMAMVFAELGRFTDAAAWQDRAISAANGAGQAALAGRMTEALRLYETGRPNRVPWRPGELP